MHEILKTRQSDETAHILRIYDPDAVIYLRLSPTSECLKQLRAAGVAAVLVHADGYTANEAPSPILANIVPNHRSIAGALEGRVLLFLRDRDSQSGTRRKKAQRKSRASSEKVVILAMQAEPGTLRYQRVESVKSAFRRFKSLDVEVEAVPGYGFQHALPVLRRHPDAIAYCCLSDELAVGVSHFFEARDGEQSAGGRARPLIIGYDDSQLARDEGISSFGQNLEEIGRIAMEQISVWLDKHAGDIEKIGFRLIETDVYLATRGTDSKPQSSLNRQDTGEG